jgi:hypothetical protein
MITLIVAGALFVAVGALFLSVSYITTGWSEA